MVIKKYATLVAVVGLALSYNLSAMPAQGFDLLDDYDVAAVSNSKSHGNTSVKEEIAINSPDDYNVSMVYRAKKVVKTASKHKSNHDLSKLDDH